MDKFFFPIIDNGMGLSRTAWATSWISVLASGLFAGKRIMFSALSSPYPDGAMNHATAEFLKTDAESMVIIDTDVIFEPRHVEFLLSHKDIAIIAGIVPQRKPGLTYSIEPLPGSTDPLAGDMDLCEVAASCRAFMRVPRKVFEVLEGLVPEYVCPYTNETRYEFWHPLPGGHSEDFNLCYMWRKAGGKVFIDRRITAKHEGSSVYPLPGTYPVT